MQSYPHFILAMRSSRGFASTAPNITPYSDSLSLRLRPEGLNLAVTVSRRIIMQKARRHPHTDVLRPLVGMWFQVHFLPLSGFFPSFARATCSLSVAREYLALGDGPRRFRPAFTCPVLLRYLTESAHFRLRDFHPLWSAFQRILLVGSFVTPYVSPTTPPDKPTVWAVPLSLAATDGVAFAFFSYGY